MFPKSRVHKVQIHPEDRAKALCALYNNSYPVGNGFLAYGCLEQMTLAEAEAIIRKADENVGYGGTFDYVRGRPVKVKLRAGQPTRTEGYDNVGGVGSFLCALDTAGMRYEKLPAETAE